MSYLKSSVGDEKEKRRGPSYFHQPGSEPLKMKTVGQAVNEAAERWPQKDAIISHYENRSLNFQQAKDQAEQLGSGLLKLGLKPGDRLAIFGVNSVHWYVTFLAAAKAGIISVLLNPAYQARELGYTLKKVGAKAIVMDYKFKTQDYPRIMGELAPGMASTPHGQPLFSSELPELSIVIVATQEKLLGCYRFQDVMNLTNDRETIHAVEENIQPDDPICIQFSSGTTGSPKAALLTHFRQINDSNNLGKRIRLTNMISSLCLQVPFFHTFGTCGIVSGLNFGITSITPAPIFLKELTLEVLQKYKVNIMFGTPTMLKDLYNELKLALPNSSKLREGCSMVELVGIGASLITPDLIDNMSKVFPNSDLVGALGMTEAGTVCFLMYRDDTIENKKSTVGAVIDHLEVKVVDKQGKMVPFGTPGEVWYRSGNNLLEYWGDEEITKADKTKAGWFKSGDVITLREDGYATIVERLKDVIIRGGENVFPTEIEQYLNSHPEILQAEVYGITDDRLGEDIAVSIRLTPSSALTETSIRDYCKGKIAHYKIPKYIKFVEQFPLTSTGKVKKILLKEILEKELAAKK